ncbi:aminotransferase class I/II-fold pyridoxal phosphate-dependent enzyme [Massilia sp. GCM10020059]|uniref:DegT/DnrJ/EryC1/StrS family aminotransferase n=1 Tax=Massilia agrisoli TaxID=2892444 RepID=A0ABS8IRY5_9BURK|nr:aminotransferase class I/II-fold pyridoxal phosphate-dependent enzyme [Massilia agrisoli]MCC6070646.1 DegT/DnrJ/EryC1/StrS family aminotransferase [Massilia agrisoli]
MASHAYPRAHVPVTPVLSAGALLGPRDPHISAMTDSGEVRLVTSGRIALALAMRAIGLAPGDRVLVPAYHSLSMIPPIVAAGAEPVFYRVRSDASADLDDIAAKAQGARALVAVNYFGFPQDLAAIRAFCDRHGLAMVEDCAHSFFGASGGRPLGSFGDYAIGSTMKFLPIYEGGCLVSSRHSLAKVDLRSAGIGFELKASLAAVERGLEYGRLPAARLPLALKDGLWKLLRRGKGKGKSAAAALTPSSSDSSYDFDPRWLDKRSSLFSRLVLRFAARGRIAQRRRANYLALQAALAGLPGMAPLFPALPADVYPWAFPVVVADPERIFAPLKMAGVPVIRFAEKLWPGVDCPDSIELSRRVFAFPCHQELTDAEIRWLAATICSVVGAA